MKLKIIGIQRRFGKSKKTGNNYDFCQIMALREIKPLISATNTLQGFGYESVAFDSTNEMLDKLSDQIFPFEAELKFDTVVSDWGKPESVVVDIKKVVPVVQVTDQKKSS